MLRSTTVTLIVAMQPIPILFATMGLVALASAQSDATTAPTPTNVLLILADDLGYMDVGFNNPDTFYETPNLDRLAASGVRFTDAYAACPVCSPTRASLLTGQSPARMHTTDYFGAPQPDAILAAKDHPRRLKRFRRLPLLPAAYVDHLPLERMTLAEALKTRGYATFFAGKWHLGGDGFGPLEQGFDVNVAGHHRGGPYGPGKYFHPFGMPGLESEEGDHLPARLAEETVDFIRARKDEPWFAMLSFYSVHTPLMGRPDLVETYERKRAALGLEAEWGKEGERKVRLVQEHAVYAAMVEAMDEAAGVVLDALEELELAEDTLVIFLSDNGGLSTSEGHPTSNLPLRAGKGWLYEGGIREPCVIRWPGRAAPSTCSVPISTIDVMPTVLDCLGHPLLPEEHRDGVSLRPLLEGRGLGAERSLYWHYPHWGNQGGAPGSAIRRGNHKLIQWSEPGRAPEFYDLAADPSESRSDPKVRPELYGQMLRDLEAWRASVGARRAIPNPLLESEER